MGAEDVKRQALNVFRMELLGAKVVAVDKGSATLKDAVNEALRHWVTNVEDTHYILGSALGPHPFPTIVRDFQRVIGDETRTQIIEQEGRLPDTVIACIGGGSNAIGMFYPFVEDQNVQLIGVEAAGAGLTTDKHAAAIYGAQKVYYTVLICIYCRMTTALYRRHIRFQQGLITQELDLSIAI